MRAVHLVVLVVVVMVLCQGLASAVEIVRDYPIRVVNVGVVGGLPTNFMREVVQVNTGGTWVGLTEFLSNNVPVALNGDPADLPPGSAEGTLMRNVPIACSKIFIEEKLLPVWLRVVATGTAGITYYENRGEQGRGTKAHCWKWRSHFVTRFVGWARVDKLTRTRAITVPVCEPRTVTRKSYYFVDP